jgi:hypothetical protein
MPGRKCQAENARQNNQGQRTMNQEVGTSAKQIASSNFLIPMS